MTKKKDERVEIRISGQEKQLIRQKMKEAGINNMSSYIRKMAIDGYIVSLDLSDVKELVRLLRYCSNNLNQYAKKANETGCIYMEDIADLERRHDRLWDMANKIMERLSAIL